MEDWQIETAERLASIERSIKYIELHMTNLPPTPACIEAHKALDTRIKGLEGFKQDILQRIAWVSGAFAVITSGLVYAVDYLKEHLFIR